MVPADISGWSSQNGQGQLDMITCHDSRKFGPHGGISGVILKKYYQLPPHWSISISMEAYLLWTWTTGQKFTVKSDDNIVYERGYQSTTYTNKHYCTGSLLSNSNLDMRIPLGVNFTHTADQLKLEILAETTRDISQQALALSNINIHVDACYYTCLTCSGPAPNQCESCPPNSDMLTTKECLCSEGYILRDLKCQQNITCPATQEVDQTIRTCVDKCNIQNCNTCQADNKNFCQLCDNGYKMVRGFCYTSCPYYTILMNDQCVDQFYQSLKRPFILTEEFTNLHFSHADLYSKSWQKKDQETQTVLSSTINVSSYSANQCDGKQLALGMGQDTTNSCSGSYCSISRSFTNLHPHFSVKIFIQVWAGGKWNNNSFQIYLDGSQIHSHTYQFVDTQPSRDFICGNDFYINDFIFDVDIPKQPHTSTSLNFELRWDLPGNSLQQWLGFRDFAIILEMCENSNCKQCNQEGQECISCKGTSGNDYSRDSTQNCACPPGYENIFELEECQLIVCKGDKNELYSRDNTKECQCPASYYDHPQFDNCQLCKNPCQTCEISDTNCITCINSDFRQEPPSCLCNKGYYQNQDNNCVKCPDGCLECQDQYNCTEKKQDTKTFFEEYWYIMLLGVVCFILSLFFCYKAYKFNAKKNNTKVAALQQQKQKQEKENFTRIKEKKITLLQQNKLRQKPRNNSYKHNQGVTTTNNTHSWGFQQLDQSNKSIERSNTRQNTNTSIQMFAKNNNSHIQSQPHLQEPNSTRSLRNNRRKSFIPPETQSAHIINEQLEQLTETGQNQHNQSQQNLLTPGTSQRRNRQNRTYALSSQAKSQFAKQSTNVD